MPSPIVLAACAAAQLSLGVDAENGAFDGMSHSGTLLVLRNLGPSVCATPALPTLTFTDPAGDPIAATRSMPRGMHPGPVILPVGIAPEAEVTAPLRWVSGDVYPGHGCATIATVSVTIAGRVMTVPLASRICGPAGAPMPYDQPVLKPDPSPR